MEADTNTRSTECWKIGQGDVEANEHSVNSVTCSERLEGFKADAKKLKGLSRQSIWNSDNLNINPTLLSSKNLRC